MWQPSMPLDTVLFDEICRTGAMRRNDLCLITLFLLAQFIGELQDRKVLSPDMKAMGPLRKSEGTVMRILFFW